MNWVDSGNLPDCEELVGAITGLSNYSRLGPIAPLAGSPSSGSQERKVFQEGFPLPARQYFRSKPVQKARPSP